MIVYADQDAFDSIRTFQHENVGLAEVLKSGSTIANFRKGTLQFKRRVIQRT